MSTDDLTARAREWARLLPDTWPETKALVFELADEVDRLRAEAGRWKARSVTAGTDLEVAPAALERVRGLAETAELAAPIGKPPYWTGHVLNALEGKS